MKEQINNDKQVRTETHIKVKKPQIKWPEMRTVISVPKAGPGEHGHEQREAVHVVYLAGRNPLQYRHE